MIKGVMLLTPVLKRLPALVSHSPEKWPEKWSGHYPTEVANLIWWYLRIKGPFNAFQVSVPSLLSIC
jgi:hypothetical protein